MRCLNTLVLLMTCCMIPALSSASPGLLDNIALGYKNASTGWYDILFPYAQRLFWLLATIEFGWSSIVWMLGRDEMGTLMAKFIKKIISIGFFYAILLHSNTWIPAIIDSFVSAGQQAAHVNGISPSEVLNTAIRTVGILFKAYGGHGLLTNLPASLLAVFVSIMIVCAHAVIAGQLLLALIESYIAISAGVLFLGFGGARWTVNFTEKQISFAFATGVKLFMLYLIIGIGQVQAANWGALLQSVDLSSGEGINTILAILGGTLIYMLLAWSIPSLASSMLSGSPHLTAGAAGMTMLTSVGAMVGTAGYTAATALGAGKVTTSLAAAAGNVFKTSDGLGQAATNHNTPAPRSFEDKLRNVARNPHNRLPNDTAPHSPIHIKFNHLED
jgi:type IV secretion system protein TrbL